jgi:chromosome segregation protein
MPKSAADTTKRVSWESVDDCLAALSPLLSELFVRLKPQMDYSEVRYHMSGDIKRFLSFEIGHGINPRFTFSSGQRRALGIAFLLAWICLVLGASSPRWFLTIRSNTL